MMWACAFQSAHPVASANAGISAAGDHDVVLLNSNTLVPPGWLEELRSVAYGAPDIGTVTPLPVDTSVAFPDYLADSHLSVQQVFQRRDRSAHDRLYNRKGSDVGLFPGARRDNRSGLG